MNILDLDEAQGLTAEMVRGWLKAHEWKHGPNYGWVSDENGNKTRYPEKDGVML